MSPTDDERQLDSARSWWVGKDREAFHRQATIEAERMGRSRLAKTIGPHRLPDADRLR